MNNERTLLQNALRVAIVSAISLWGVLNASAADTYMYRDIKQPNGFPRDAAAKQTDLPRAVLRPKAYQPAHSRNTIDVCVRTAGRSITS